MAGKAELAGAPVVSAVMVANRAAPAVALAATVMTSPMAANRQYCSDRRNGRPAISRQAAPRGIVHNGCQAGAAGSASHRATGTDRAAKPPSKATLTAMRIQERAPAMGRV